jgi:hypothetical protein
MNITISIIYKGYTSRILQRGSFPVNARRFKEDPHLEAARVTCAWIKQIRREAHIEEIIEVIYDDNNEITDLVLKIEKAPLE